MNDETEDLGDVGDDWAAALAEQEIEEQAQEAATPQQEADNVAAAALDDFSGAEQGAFSHGDENMDMILDIPVTISMEIGRTKIAIRNLLQLNQGSVVELDRLAGEPMDVRVNGTLIAHGEVVVVNEKFGIRLTDVVSAQERIKKLR
ncbi:flagellar motor switch protein FliN [Pseudomonadota bacterium]